MELPRPPDGVLVKIIKGRWGTGRFRVKSFAMLDTAAQASAAPAASTVAPAQAGPKIQKASAPSTGAASPPPAKIAARAGVNTADIAGTGPAVV